MGKKSFRKTIERIWPKTKQEMGKAIVNARDFMDKTESSLKILSEKSAAGVKELTLTLKKDKLCFELGKSAASIPPAKWAENKKITGLLKEIKDVERQIRKAK